MMIRVLGSAAGGGFPQWNCNCTNCARLRNGTINAKARTQSSIAVSGDARNWILFNASPDIRAQLEAFPVLQPGRSVRDTAIVGVVLIDGQIDHTAGLLFLREGDPINLYCTEPVHEDLTTGNPILKVLDHFCGVNWHRVPLNSSEHFTVRGADHLQLTAIPLDGKPPPFSPYRDEPRPGDNIGVLIEDARSGASVFYAPALAGLDERIAEVMKRCDCVLVDGTFWSDDELVTSGIGDKRAQDMGHLPQSGDDGMIRLLAAMDRPRRVLIHINNTNPILDEESPQRAQLNAAGIEVACDGMEITL